MPEKPNSSELLKTTFRALAQAGAEAAHTIQNVVLPPRREILQKQEKNWALLDLNKNLQSVDNKAVTEIGETQRSQKSAHFLTEGTLPDNLRRLVDVWDDLPGQVRRAILVLAEIEIEKMTH